MYDHHRTKPATNSRHIEGGRIYCKVLRYKRGLQLFWNNDLLVRSLEAVSLVVYVTNDEPQLGSRGIAQASGGGAMLLDEGDRGD